MIGCCQCTEFCNCMNIHFECKNNFKFVENFIYICTITMSVVLLIYISARSLFENLAIIII